ncbi:MAG: LacI family DNA-binding transcriptional regulator [Verrucomicrobiota bacterium]|nr:LacI family DNA-binding transcriptional regulator [Verrucomicrobiota bacterium]
MKDIAEASGGLSVAAVSYALRGAPEVSKETQERVRTIAAQLGYQPRPEISQLASRRWKNRISSGLKVAYITHASALKNGGRLYNTVKATALARGFVAEAFYVEHYPDAGKMANVLNARGIEALVVSPLFQKEFVENFPWANFTGINVQTGYYAPQYSHVFPALLDAGCSAYRIVMSRGYRRIGFAWIREPVEPIDGWEKEAAYLLSNQLAMKDDITLLTKEFSLDNAFSDFVTWVREHNLDAIIAQTPSFYNFGITTAGDLQHVGCVCLNVTPAERQYSGFILDFELLLKRAWLELDMQLRIFQRGIPEAKSCSYVTMPWNEGSTLPSCPRPNGPSL